MSTQSGVAVLPNKLRRGLNVLADAGTRAKPIRVVPLGDALAREWLDDAHGLIYLNHPRDPDEPMFRCNKSVLPELRAKGSDLLAHVIPIDWDTPGHVPWSVPLWHAFEQQLAEIAERARRGDPVAAKAQVYLDAACAWWSSRRGCRWLWRLSTPVPVDQVESRVRGLAHGLRAAGLEVDLSESVAGNWTQPFRLPRVVRDGTRTSEDPFFFCEVRT